MSTVRILFHMARADFLERVRRYSFIAMLGMIIWLGYAVNTGALVLSVPPNYVGEIDSAWVGVLMTVTVGLFLGWFGFYLVKGSIARDYETGVGQIIATTPLSRPFYMLGKWLSNFAVLLVMVLIMMAAGVVMVLWIGRAPLDLWALISPLLFLSVPLLALVAAAAVLFEAIGWLRGGFGNVVYWFMFVLALVPGISFETSYHPLLDFTGMRLVGESIVQSAQAAYPVAEKGFSFLAMQSISAPQIFHYSGLAFTAAVILPRLLLVLAAMGIAVLSSVFFDRFNSSKAARREKRPASSSPPETIEASAAALPPVRLTPLEGRHRFHFAGLYKAELRLLLKGHRWWWYMALFGLLVGQLLVPGDSGTKLLAITWLWLILPLSSIGSREADHNTEEIVFSAPRPAINQLSARWAAAITFVAAAGSTSFLRYLAGGDTAHVLAWFGGILFIPALAMALGVMTRSRKPFEVVYVTWMYIVLQPVASLDFVGEDPGSPWHLYLLLGLGLFALSVLLRRSRH